MLKDNTLKVGNLGKGGKMVKKTKKRKQTAWMKHLLSFHRAHPNKTFSECMILARKTYKKKK